MRIAKNIALASVAALALTVGAGLALAQSFHTMTVPLSDGGLAQIEYSGNVAPRVAFAPEPLAIEYLRPVPPFVLLDGISEQMDRDMAALLSDVASGPPLVNAEQMFDPGLRNPPLGAAQYSIVSTMTGDGQFCTRSMEITRGPTGSQPHIVTHMSGNCQGVGNMGTGAAPRPRPAPSIETKVWPGDQHARPKLLDVAYRPDR